MMGIREGQKGLFNYQVDLDRRVRRDNPLRAIRETVDFTWAREEVALCSLSLRRSGNVASRALR